MPSLDARHCSRSPSMTANWRNQSNYWRTESHHNSHRQMSFLFAGCLAVWQCEWEALHSGKSPGQESNGLSSVSGSTHNCYFLVPFWASVFPICSFFFIRIETFGNTMNFDFSFSFLNADVEPPPTCFKEFSEVSKCPT